MKKEAKKVAIVGTGMVGMSHLKNCVLLFRFVE